MNLGGAVMTNWKKAFLTAAVGVAALTGPVSAHVIPLTDRQIAAGSAHVVVAVVEEARARWNDQHTLIFTDYSLRVEDRLRGEAPERITVSMPGGMLDGQGHDVCVSVPLEAGSRYLLFLKDLDQRSMVPITGGWQGAFREVSGPRGKRMAAHDPRGETPGRSLEAGVEFSKVIRDTRELLKRVEADPRPEDTAWTREVENVDLPTKAYDPSPQTAPVGTLPSEQDEAKAGQRFYVEHPAVAPLVFDTMPPDSPFYRADQKMMAYWNVYLKRPLFLVNRNPSPGWAYGDGVSEIVGFPSSESMEEQFGVGWAGGFYSAVLTIYREDGRTIEVDIAMNPARDWIVGEWEVDVQFGGTCSFMPVVLQHLARGWGYRGPYDLENLPDDPAELMTDSLLGVAGFVMAAIPAVDAEAVRATFGGRPLRDGLISPYSILITREGFLGSSFAYAGVETAKAGTSFNFISPIKIENPGTVTLARPTVEVHLVPTRGSLRGGILLKRIRVEGSVKSGESMTVDLGSATIPAKVRAGTYHFAFVLRDPKDAYQPNNTTYSSPDSQLTVTR